MKRLLVLSHGHPLYSKGGGEHAAYALHQSIGALQGWQSLLVAAAPDSQQFSVDQLDFLQDDPTTCLVAPTPDWLLFESVFPLGHSSKLKHLVVEWSPDVVHVHHFHRLGLDVVLALRQWCPKARLVFTLHEFLMLCPYQGQLLTAEGALCLGPSLEGCSCCLPNQDSSDLELRDGLMRALLRSVDVFMAPSRFLADRFRSWARDKCNVRVVPNCPPLFLNAVDTRKEASAQGELPCRFGFFGNPGSFSKGLDLVLEGFLAVLDAVPTASLLIGGDLPPISKARSELEKIYLERVWGLLERLGSVVSLVGGYHQSEVPALMASVHWVVMGSRWFENAPVVIEEAKLCRRPILVPGHGGMAEQVIHGRDGWHFQPGDAADLATWMRACCQDFAGWQRLVNRMKPGADRQHVVRQHLEIYGDSI